MNFLYQFVALDLGYIFYLLITTWKPTGAEIRVKYDEKNVFCDFSEISEKIWRPKTKFWLGQNLGNTFSFKTRYFWAILDTLGPSSGLFGEKGRFLAPKPHFWRFTKKFVARWHFVRLVCKIPNFEALT